MKNVFYQVDQYQTYKTFDAWHQILSGAKSWRLALFEDSFSTVDWTLEPDHSFEDLVSIRVSLLTKKYKKIRLWYSAGRDSNYVLNALIKRNIQVDEIVFVDWAFHDLVKHEKDEVISVLKSKFKTGSVPKITIFTPGREHYSAYWKVVSKQQHSGGIGSNYGPNLNSFSVLLDLFFETDENTCNLFGLEKPKLFVKNNNLIFQMADSSVQHVMTPHHHVEWFFMQDACPDLVKKQIFMLYKGASALAASKKITLESALSLLQFNKAYYHLYCLILGLGPSALLSTENGGAKSFGLTKTQYAGLELVQNTDCWDSKKFYRQFCATTSALITQYRSENQTTKLPGIVSREYVIKKGVTQ